MARKVTHYVNTSEVPYHYPGGVLCLNEAAALTPDEAKRGLDAGVLIETTAAAEPEPESHNEEN